MALKVELKPNERILIGESVITNCDQRSWLVIEGSSPILREKDILTAGARRHAGQAHLSRGAADVHVARPARAPRDLLSRWCARSCRRRPAPGRYVEIINNQILTGNLYKALKEAKKLIAYEEELLRACEARPKPTKTWQGKPSNPRELEANAAAPGRRPSADRCTTPGTRTRAQLDDALLYNRKLWSVFLSRDDRRATIRCRGTFARTSPISACS